MPGNTTRWTVSAPKQTDIAMRSHLAQRGMKRGDLSRFIKEAVRLWRGDRSDLLTLAGQVV